MLNDFPLTKALLFFLKNLFVIIQHFGFSSFTSLLYFNVTFSTFLSIIKYFKIDFFVEFYTFVDFNPAYNRFFCRKLIFLLIHHQFQDKHRYAHLLCLINRL